MNNDAQSAVSGMQKITSPDGYFRLHQRVLSELPHAVVQSVARKLSEAYENGRGVFIFGNGGSAALASHLACDLGKGTSGLGNPKQRFKAVSLTDNMPLLTAWANDSSYDQVFAEQVRNIVQTDDIVFAISASGNSPNVLRGLEAGREAGAFNVGLAGFKGGKMKALCDLCIVIPSDHMQIVEDFQLSVSHALFLLVCRNIQARAASALSMTAGAA